MKFIEVTRQLDSSTMYVNTSLIIAVTDNVQGVGCNIITFREHAYNVKESKMQVMKLINEQ